MWWRHRNGRTGAAVAPAIVGIGKVHRNGGTFASTDLGRFYSECGLFENCCGIDRRAVGAGAAVGIGSGADAGSGVSFGNEGEG